MSFEHEIVASLELRDVFHGTNREAAYEIVGKRTWIFSNGPGEWLGEGAYFFEAKNLAEKWALGKFKAKAAVLKVSVKFEVCLNLADDVGQSLVDAAQAALKSHYKQSGKPLPINVGDRQDLQCAIFNLLFQRASPTIQTVRAIARRGQPFSQAGTISFGDHVQVSVRDLKCFISDPELVLLESRG